MKPVGIDRDRVRRRVKPPAYVCAAFVAMLAVHVLFPLARILAFPWNLLGVIPFLFGAALAGCALRQFACRKTTPEPFGVSAALVTDGVFRLSRNPMYLGILLMASGVSALLGSASPWLAVAGLGLVLDVVFVRPEEKRMEERFGEDYRRYRIRVRRWVSFPFKQTESDRTEAKGG